MCIRDRYKMNTYIYGPKDDVFHGFSKRWREPYPADMAKDLKELVYPFSAPGSRYLQKRMYGNRKEIFLCSFRRRNRPYLAPG